MRNRYITTLGLFLAFIAVLSGCATTSAPPGWLQNANKTQAEAFGGWITIEHKSPLKGVVMATSGELIAVNSDSIFVYTLKRLKGFPIADITCAKLMTYNSNAGYLDLWTVLGLISTPSHGHYLAFTVPLWLIFGIASSSSQSNKPQLTYPKRDWNEIRMYARFPQGLPPSLNRQYIKSKRFLSKEVQNSP